jgi:competence protein ComEA
MRKWINSYFNFTKSEFNGILALFIIIVLVTALPRIYVWVFPNLPAKEEMAEIQKLELEGKLKPLAEKKAYQRSGAGYATRAATPGKIDLSYFDPNTMDQQGWENKGLSPKQAGAIIKYVSKGGKFRKAEDLKKMYTISPELYEMLKPFVHIENVAAALKTPSFTKSKYPVRENAARIYAVKEKKVYELNGLDTNGLQAIYRIGHAFARRIFKYRERLGGFYQADQLLEVYGIDSSRFLALESQVKVNTALIKHININEVEFDELRHHPYLTFKQANAIIAYRKQHGNYSSFAALKKVAILPSETVDKLAPYLTFYDNRNKN